MAKRVIQRNSRKTLIRLKLNKKVTKMKTTLNTRVRENKKRKVTVTELNRKKITKRMNIVRTITQNQKSS
jgi:hypothetical protein